MEQKPPRRRASFAGPRTLSAVVPRVAADALRRRGFAQGAIVSKWPEIVGRQLAAASAPERLIFPRGGGQGATLHVRAASALALELQHLAPVVIERINAYFGYAAVARLALSQGPLPGRKRNAAGDGTRKLTEAEDTAVTTAVAGAQDPDLKAALAALGRRVMGATK